jgi:hypothetical protein
MCIRNIRRGTWDEAYRRSGIAKSMPPAAGASTFNVVPTNQGSIIMGRGILLWLLGEPIPIILLLAMCSHI